MTLISISGNSKTACFCRGGCNSYSFSNGGSRDSSTGGSREFSTGSSRDSSAGGSRDSSTIYRSSSTRYKYALCKTWIRTTKWCPRPSIGK